MTEREKVIKGLECCSDAVLECGENCPYWNIENCQSSMQDDALALLKAQEPIEPYTERDGRTTFFLCGGCNKPLCIAKDSYKPKHCPECGQAVKWDG